jgi:hypothetical protein
VSFWTMLQILVDVFLGAGLVLAWAKLTRPAKDDPRLSRGLQLLQSKIAILEDLSDRIETQVQQLNALMEQKAREVQGQLLAADKQIQRIETSMVKSMEVAQIFQDRIPHGEIVERQNTLKYIKAAKLAHQGASVDEISQQVDLGIGEIEFIAKVNRDQLQFSEDALPAWAKADPQPGSEAPIHVAHPPAEAPPIPTPERSLSNLGDKFRNAFTTPGLEITNAHEIQIPTTPARNTRNSSAVDMSQIYIPPVRSTRPMEPDVRKVVFPRIDATRNLG